MKALMCAVLILAVAPAASAAHPSRFFEYKANLDADRALERVRAEEGASSDHATFYARVAIIDRCGGRVRRHDVIAHATTYSHVVTAELVQADARGPRELLAVVKGAAGRGAAKVVRLRQRSSSCPRPYALFSYDASQPADPPAPGFTAAGFRVEAVELARRYRGRELRLTEDFQMPPMLSSLQRETLFRYDVARDRYVAYATQTNRVP